MASAVDRAGAFAFRCQEGEEPAAAAADDPNAALKAEKKELKAAIADMEAKLKIARGEAASAQEAAKDAGENGYMLLAANFERFRLQAKDELGAQKGFGRLNTARSLLPFVEQFEVLQAERGDDDGEAGAGAIHKYYGGIWKQTQQLLESWKVAPYEVAPGTAYDYKRHSISETVASEEVAANVVMEMVTRGWEMDGEVVRPAKCVMSSGPPAPPEAADGGEEEADAASE